MIEKQMPYKYKVYEIIKKGIIDGTYQAGVELNERTLSETLGVSRTPIREAIQVLERDGWVVLETYKGAVIRSFDHKYLSDLMKVRTALEVSAVEDAAKHITEEYLKEIRRLFEVQRQAVEETNVPVYQFIQMDREFHLAIYKLSENKTLISLLDNLNDMICVAGMRALTSDVRRQETLAEHKEVLNALEEGDPQKAIQAMRYHMEKTTENIQQHADISQ